MNARDCDWYGQPIDPEQLARLGAVMAQSFGFAPAEATGWFSSAGVENLRCLRRGGDAVAGLLRIPMGQFWGGCSVPMMGLAGVAVAPHMRGARVATSLLLAALREARAEGFALATLYPTTQALYRGVGFEQAGARYLMSGPLAAVTATLAGGERALPVRPFSEREFVGVQALYARVAHERQGWLDRGPYVWTRVRNPGGTHSFGYVVGEAEQVEGFLFYSLASLPGLGKRHELRISGWEASSPAVWRRLCTLIADHASMVEQVTWHGGSDDPLLLLASEQALNVSIRDFWMLRLLDVRAAMQVRGYAPTARGTLHVQLDDRSLPENSGQFVLQVAGGRGAVEPGGRGELQCNERALAAMYAGHRSASQLQRLGMLRGPRLALELADALFAGGPASLPDQF